MKKLNVRNIVFWGIMLFIIGVGIFNACFNDEFWDVSFPSCISIFIALVVSYYFNKINNDERNQKEKYLKIMEKIQNIVNQEYMFKITDSTDTNRILMKKRELNNAIIILKEYSTKFNLEKEISFVGEKIQEYADFFGNHQSDISYLKKSEIDLQRPLELIDSKLQEAMIKLFD